MFRVNPQKSLKSPLLCCQLEHILHSGFCQLLTCLFRYFLKIHNKRPKPSPFSLQHHSLTPYSAFLKPAVQLTSCTILGMRQPQIDCFTQSSRALTGRQCGDHLLLKLTVSELTDHSRGCFYRLITDKDNLPVIVSNETRKSSSFCLSDSPNLFKTHEP